MLLGEDANEKPIPQHLQPLTPLRDSFISIIFVLRLDDEAAFALPTSGCYFQLLLLILTSYKLEILLYYNLQILP